jgi:carbon monoxide dehydrogenase subunit G
MAALDSIGASRGERAVLMARDLTIPLRSCQSKSAAFATANMHPPCPEGALPFGVGLLYLEDDDATLIREATMAMTMNGEVQLAAPREAVWDKLNDPAVLKVCIPGCEELEKTDDGGFHAVAKMKVGPVSARFKGKVTLSDLDPPNGYKISGEGEGGVAGFAKGGATVRLSEKDGGTLLSYDVEAQIGGKLAQLGQRLINGTAKKLADEFFANFAKAVQG